MDDRRISEARDTHSDKDQDSEENIEEEQRFGCVCWGVISDHVSSGGQGDNGENDYEKELEPDASHVYVQPCESVQYQPKGSLRIRSPFMI